MDLRRRVSASVFNSVLTGFPNGIRMNQPSVYDNYNEGRGVLQNNILVALENNAFRAGTGVDADNVKDYWLEHNTFIAGPFSDQIHTDLGLKSNDIFFGNKLADQYPQNPDFTVTAGILSTGADFSHAKFGEPHRTGFFDEVNFIGAFGSDNWTSGWTEFDPVNAEY